MLSRLFRRKPIAILADRPMVADLEQIKEHGAALGLTTMAQVDALRRLRPYLAQETLAPYLFG